MIFLVGGVFTIGIVLLIALFFWRRKWAIVIASLVAVCLFQFNGSLLGWAFSVLSLWLAAVTWLFTRADDQPLTRADRLTLAFMVALGAIQAALLSGAAQRAALGIGLVALPVAFGGALLLDRRVERRALKLGGLIALIVILFVILKSALYGWLVERLDTGAETVTWFGFSYITFRLIHTLRERQLNRLPTLSLPQFLAYVFFFPALIAGPIDRCARFVSEFERPYRPPNHVRLVESAYRIMIGMTRKFVIADTLSLIALNMNNAAQVGTVWTWVQLYAYAFQLFFDFSGYTDMAIGVGLLFGIKLPENFDRPYSRRNLALFWQSWHMTLSNWVRFYVFLPLSRALIKRNFMASMAAQVLVSQVVTLLIIGLWHGVTLNFAIWGLWHGVGLFVHNRWSSAARQWHLGLRQHPRRRELVHALGIVITFHYVTLGWVWFALPDVRLAVDVFGRLLGVS